MPDTEGLKPYRTVKAAGEGELLIQKSRFIGRCFPVENEAEAAARLEEIRRRHYDATHNCYAMRIGKTAGTARSSDDGEPSGTAGMPILNVLLKQDLTNVLCVVTRYFGGVLLGAGGLIRAYTASAVQAVEAASVIEAHPARLYDLTVPYPLWQLTESLLRRDAKLEQVAFTDSVQACFWVEEKTADALLALLLNRSDGKLVPVLICRDLLLG